MAEKEKKDKKFFHRLKSRYRLVLVNDATFDERFSAYLTPLNVISGVTAVVIVISIFVVSVIVFTPVKEYIPGYSDSKTRISALRAAVRADSLAEAQRIYEQYFDHISRVLAGDVLDDTIAAEPEAEKRITYDNLSFAISREDSILRKEIESEERFALNPGAGFSSVAMGLPGVFFFTPLRGAVSSSFDASIGHYGVDIAADEGDAVSAVYDGTIVLASFTSDGGYVIQIQHANNLVSVYKHNSALLKKQGDRVEAGDIIAVVGNTGEYTDGPHLHFELWYNGTPLDPQAFIAFSS
ncbi:MAG: M23 family metallopeptidase [Cryomorphaceae bacterium]|nr:M23 family metallopeptidase [Flavobacteriales bacterium]